MFLETRWGGMSLVSLYLSVLSGLVVALQYDPGTPFYSTGVIELLAPFGHFWRSCHFYTSQMFFLFSLFHLVVIILVKADLKMPFGKWLLLVGSVPASLLLLFSGYVLRADATGEAAGLIAENITLSIPYLGDLLNSLLFAIEAEGMKRVYANHLIGLGVVWGICCWDHLRRYRVGIGQYGGMVAAVICFCLFVPAPMEPARLGVFHIQGPWFFLGLQELLRHLEPLSAGVFIPASLMGALLLAPKEEQWRGRLFGFIVVWLGLYGGLTLVALLRGYG